MADKIFAKGLFIKKHYFDNGGEILNCTFSVDSFTKFLEDNKKIVQNKKGENVAVVKLSIKENQEGKPYAELNAYEHSQD